MSKILVFNGSPRKKGNTAVLIEELVKNIDSEKNDVEVIRLNELVINPCQFCNWCINNNALSCVQKDDMNNLYPKLLDSDVLVFASPIFWFNVSAQMKLFIDRLYALHGKDGYALIKKKVASILVYGDSDVEKSGVNNAIGSLKDLFRYIRSENIGMIHGTAYKLGDAAKNNKLLADARELGRKISQN